LSLHINILYSNKIIIYLAEYLYFKHLTNIMSQKLIRFYPLKITFTLLFYTFCIRVYDNFFWHTNYFYAFPIKTLTVIIIRLVACQYLYYQIESLIDFYSCFTSVGARYGRQKENIARQLSFVSWSFCSVAIVFEAKIKINRTRGKCTCT